MSIAFGPRWYVVQTHPHAERRVSVHLHRQGFITYFPRYLKLRRHARRVDKVAAPLFSRYLFVSVECATQRWHSIDSTFGVVRLVRAGDRPAQVPEYVIEALKHREDADGFVQLAPRPRFAPGDKVRVSSGAFCDCVGFFQGMTGEERVAILLELLGREVRVALDGGIIEAA